MNEQEEKEVEMLGCWVWFYKTNSHHIVHKHYAEYRHDSQYAQYNKARIQLREMKEEFNLKK